MAKDKNRSNFRNTRHDRFWTGLVLIIIGGVLLIQRAGVDLPHWLFTWPMILILVGLVTGLKHRFNNSSWIIFVGIGAFFLADDMITDMNLKPYFWPILIIGLGLLFILRPKKTWHLERDRLKEPDRDTKQFEEDIHSIYEPTSTEDMVNSTSIFGGVKKMITSKDFKGGEIVCFMGGAEINLSQSDILGPVTIEIMQAFGGTKLVVPPHWEIRSEVVAIFAGIEDKRPPMPGVFDPKKILIIKGTTIFGGIEIKSY
jgi:predicted membrane protein